MLFPTREPFSVRTNETSEVNWLGTSFYTGFSPRRFLTYRTLLDTFEDHDFAEQHRREGSNHHDPRLGNVVVRPADDLNLTPPAVRANRRNNSTPDSQGRATPPAPGNNISPWAQRELERLDKYNWQRESRRSIRRIIKAIQDKRREEFRVLREALYQIYHYSGPYLQNHGEKAAAADLIRKGGLGAEFVHVFDNEAKWQWIQLRVNAL